MPFQSCYARKPAEEICGLEARIEFGNVIGLNANQRGAVIADEAKDLADGGFKVGTGTVCCFYAFGDELADLVTADALLECTMDLF